MDKMTSIIFLLLAVIVFSTMVLSMGMASSESFVREDSRPVSCSSCEECNEKIAVAGEGETVRLDSNIISKSGTCIDFEGKDKVILDCQGHTIGGTGTGYGISLPSDSDYNTLKNCLITDFCNGINIFESDYVRTIDNILQGNALHGIYVEKSLFNTISCNELKGNNYGLVLEQVSDSVVKKNTVQNNSGYGIRFHGITDDGEWVQSNLTFVENTVTDHEGNYGIFVDTIENATIASNYFQDNQFGIRFYYSPNSTIENNDVCNSTTTGIDLYSSFHDTIRNNMVEFNDVGIYFVLSSDNLVYNNYFKNAENSASDGSNSWNTTRTEGENIIRGNYLGGNYWTNYEGDGFSDRCSDADSDGICDKAYIIDDQNADNLPLASSEKIRPDSISR